MSSIFYKKLNWKTSCQNLIKYSNNLKENDKEENVPIKIELSEQNADPYNDENAIDFK